MLGIMHSDRDDAPAFDGARGPKVDRAVLDFVKATVFDPADFVIRSHGVCRLNPEMARMAVAKVSAQKVRTAKANPARPSSVAPGNCSAKAAFSQRQQIGLPAGKRRGRILIAKCPYCKRRTPATPLVRSSSGRRWPTDINFVF